MGLNGYTADGQDPKVVQRVLGKLRHLLGDEERIHYVVVQRKGTINLFPDSIVVTDTHLFLCEYTKMGLDLNVEVLPWSKMRTIRPERSANGVTLRIIPETEIDYIIENIPAVQAERLLTYAREQAEGSRSPISESVIEPKPTVVEESVIEPKPTVVEESVIEPKPTVVEESVVLPEQEIVPATVPKPEPPVQAAQVPDPDSMLEKLQSLYLRQRITRSEYEFLSKKQQLEN